jgi:hypothetical protein
MIESSSLLLHLTHHHAINLSLGLFLPIIKDFSSIPLSDKTSDNLLKQSTHLVAAGRETLKLADAHTLCAEEEENFYLTDKRVRARFGEIITHFQVLEKFSSLFCTRKMGKIEEKQFRVVLRKGKAHGKFEFLGAGCGNIDKRCTYWGIQDSLALLCV